MTTEELSIGSFESDDSPVFNLEDKVLILHDDESDVEQEYKK